jgi:hypothetical protein
MRVRRQQERSVQEQARPTRAVKILCHKCSRPYVRLLFADGKMVERQRIDACRCDEAALAWVQAVVGEGENPRNPSPAAVLRVLRACRYIPGCGRMPGSEVAQVMDDPDFSAAVANAEARRVRQAPAGEGERPATVAQHLARVVSSGSSAPETGQES